MSETRFVDVRRFESIDSTNRYLLDEARAGAPEGVVAVADHQTAGRGRLGRTWEAPPGANLLLSVLLRPAIEPGLRHLATAAVALAALDALPGSGVLEGIAVGIKWPNDLVTPDGRKLAGVLAEADLGAGSGAPPPVVVGIGINVNWPARDDDLPPGLQGTAVSLRQLTGGPVDREALLDGLLAAPGPPDGRPGDGGGEGPTGRRPAGCLHHARIAGAGGVGGRLVRGDGGGGDRWRPSHGRGRRIERTVVAGDVVHVRTGP